MKLIWSQTLAVFAAGIALSGFTAQAEMLPASAYVQQVRGSALLVDAHGVTRPLVTGSRLQAGDTVVTEASSTADLLLEETGATIGLEAESRLKIEVLGYRDEAAGRRTETYLDLQKGELLGNVDKLSPGSRFEVQMPGGVASVRGTTFFVNALLGHVHVTKGTVVVKVIVKLGSTTQTKQVTVSAGNSLLVPVLWNSKNSLSSLKATKTSWLYSEKVLNWLAAHTSVFEKYQVSGNVRLEETFKGRRLGCGNLWVLSPPKIELVSY
jgi:ferric-dicitrate binding protein FerR (iron transport regulator)